MEKFYISGVFPENNMMPGVKKVSGGEFTLKHLEAGWEATFYYHKTGTKKDPEYTITMPCNGLAVYRGYPLKACKQWCLEHLDMITDKCETQDAIREEKWFAEAVREAIEKERFSV